MKRNHIFRVNGKTGHFCAVLGVCLTLAFTYGYRAYAQDGLPDASQAKKPEPTDILSPEMKVSEVEYKKVKETLKPEQVSVLEELENAYIASLGPEMEVARLSLQLKSCVYENKDKKEEDASVFSAYKLEKKRQSQSLKEKAANAYKEKTQFIEPGILTKHIAVFMYFAKNVSLQALRGQMQGTKPEALCKQGQDLLGEYAP